MVRQWGGSVQNGKEIIAFSRVLSRPGKEAKVLLSVRTGGVEQQKKATVETPHD
jgi:hypothetical protein